VDAGCLVEPQAALRCSLKKELAVAAVIPSRFIANAYCLLEARESMWQGCDWLRFCPLFFEFVDVCKKVRLLCLELPELVRSVPALLVELLLLLVRRQDHRTRRNETGHQVALLNYLLRAVAHATLGHGGGSGACDTPRRSGASPSLRRPPAPGRGRVAALAAVYGPPRAASMGLRARERDARAP